jgi:hypothetical protein
MRFRTKISGMQFDPARVSSIPAGKQIVTDGPFIETKELMGGGLGVAAVRRHISPVVISRVRTLGRGEQKPGAKPQGLWYDVEGEWERWCREEDTRGVKPESVRYRLKLDHSIMLLLSTAASLWEFSRHYRLGKHSGAGDEYIDWSRVASEYAS